jgi:hypothetical protein
LYFEIELFFIGEAKMSDMISGVAGQLFQQILENQTKQQPQATQNRTFESYLQQDIKTQTQTDDKTVTCRRPPRLHWAKAARAVSRRVGKIVALAPSPVIGSSFHELIRLRRHHRTPWHRFPEMAEIRRP